MISTLMGRVGGILIRATQWLETDDSLASLARLSHAINFHIPKPLI